MELQQYDFDIAYRKGQLIVVADVLSRQAVPNTLHRAKDFYWSDLYSSLNMDYAKNIFYTAVNL